MDSIVDALNAFRQTTEFTELLPVMRLLFSGLLCGVFVAVTAIATRDDLIADVRAALRDIGMVERQAADAMAMGKAALSLKFSGERPLTFNDLASLPDEFFQWFALRLSYRVGLPEAVEAGARMTRRQVRMTLDTAQEKEIA